MFAQCRYCVLKTCTASRIRRVKALGRLVGAAAAGGEPRGAASRRQETSPPPICRTNDTDLVARSARLETHPSSPSVACCEISARDAGGLENYSSSFLAQLQAAETLGVMVGAV